MTHRGILKAEKNKMKSKDRDRVKEILLLPGMRFQQSKWAISVQWDRLTREWKSPIRELGLPAKKDKMKQGSKGDCEGYLLFYRRTGSDV